ncbi:MAG: Crp/Fnr family transcriptional regulator [Sulfobacillus sp.]
MRVDEIPLLAGLEPNVRTQSLVMRHFSEGEVIFHQGTPTTGLWMVLNGRVAIEHIGARGGLVTSGIWVPGDIIGIAGLWDQSGYPGSARALDTPTEIAWMDRATALSLHQQVPSFAIAISEFLARRLRFVQENIANRQGRPVIQQLSIILSMLSRRTGAYVRLTHEDLAHMIGTHRETISRTLQELQKLHLIESGYGEIHVLDQEGLEKLVDDF